jgi:pyruvyltransferase
MTAEDPAILAYWCRTPSRPNFGDALTPWLIKRLTGRHPRFAWPADPRSKIFVTGSTLSLAGAHCTVWGAGIMNADDPVRPETRLLAVRGPLSRHRALACGAECPEIYGDPALLLPQLLSPPPAAPDGPALVAHYSDFARLKGRTPPGLRLIDVQGKIEDVVAQIGRSSWVMSSSLHGLIVSHAYGVPAAWVEFRPLPSGDGSKFRDYLASVDQDPAGPVRLSDDCAGFAAVERKARRPREIDVGGLWRTCPFLDRATSEAGGGARR